MFESCKENGEILLFQLEIVSLPRSRDAGECPATGGRLGNKRGCKLPDQDHLGFPKVQTAVPHHDLRSGQAAKSAITRPQGLRHKPSIEPSFEPSHTRVTSDVVERLQAFQGKQEGSEVVQNRIARRIGDDGGLSWAR